MARSVRMARHVNEKVRRSGYRNWIQWLVRQGLGWGQVEIPWNEPRGRIQAQVTGGLWYATCPDCKTAIIVDDQEPVLFCVTCLCAKNDGHPYEVSFAGQREIEDLFAKRKDPRTRNWLPGETIEELKAEQLERGELAPGKTPGALEFAKNKDANSMPQQPPGGVD